jgi:hypothetical protein
MRLIPRVIKCLFGKHERPFWKTTFGGRDILFCPDCKKEICETHISFGIVEQRRRDRQRMRDKHRHE